MSVFIKKEIKKGVRLLSFLLMIIISWFVAGAIKVHNEDIETLEHISDADVAHADVPYSQASYYSQGTYGGGGDSGGGDAGDAGGGTGGGSCTGGTSGGTGP